MSVESQSIARPVARPASRTRLLPIVAIVGALVIVALGVLALYLYEMAPAPIQPMTGIQQEHAKDDPILYGYGWVDQKNGIAHIPIQDAIEILAQKGLPSRPASAQTAKDEGQTIPSYSSSGTAPEQVLH
jgi:hypothetical protein